MTNRANEIRERILLLKGLALALLTGGVVPGRKQEAVDLCNNLADDIAHLLARVEELEKALEWIDGHCNPRHQAVRAIKELARTALEEK